MLPVLFLWLTTAGLQAPAPAEVVRDVDHFEFTYALRLPEIKGEGRIWLPIARTDAFQKVRVIGITAPCEWKTLRDRDYGNELLYLAVDSRSSGAAVEVRYEVTRSEKSAYAAPADQTRRFLLPDRLVPIEDRFRRMASEATAGLTKDLDRGRALYGLVLEQMRYDKSGTGWGSGDAAYACDVRAGNCTDFHSYFIALARSVGIPARFAIGATIPADKPEGLVGGYHCWAEFYADGKWIPVDISEAWKHPDLALYYFGHQPANRIELSAGRDLVVEPGPAAGPINFLAYPVFEVDGKPAKADVTFSFHRGPPMRP